MDDDSKQLQYNYNNFLPRSKIVSDFDYFYEFSETRKVLDEFFKPPMNVGIKKSTTNRRFDDFNYDLQRVHVDQNNQLTNYIGKRLAFNHRDNSNNTSLPNSPGTSSSVPVSHFTIDTQYLKTNLKNYFIFENLYFCKKTIICHITIMSKRGQNSIPFKLLVLST